MAEIHFATASGRIRLPVAELGARPGTDPADPAASPDPPSGEFTSRPSGPEFTLLDAVRHVGLPLGQSCRGEGVCRSCAVDIEAGGEHLGALTSLERRFGFHDTRRLACQACLPAPAGNHIVLVTHRAWGRPPAADPAADPAAPANATGATLEP